MSKRIWEEFLTEQDQQAVERSPKVPLDLFASPRKPALLLVDFFRGVFGDRPQELLDAIEEWPDTCGMAAWESIPPTQRLLESCRRAGIPIIFSTGIVEGNIQGKYARSRPASNEGTPRVGRWVPPEVRYEIVPEVGPLQGETVIRKIAASVFWGTPLVGQLIKNQIDTLIVCGESTSGCVRSTVIDASQFQFDVILVEDCTFDRHQAAHAINLFDMHRKFAEVLPLGDALNFADRHQTAALEVS